MKVTIQDVGKIVSSDESSNELSFRIPFTFSLGKGEHLDIAACVLEEAAPDLQCKKNVKIFPTLGNEELKKPIILRPEDVHGTNKLEFEFTIRGENIASRLDGQQIFLILALVFRGTTRIEFAISARCSLENREIEATIDRASLPWKVIVNLLLLTLPLLLLSFWNNKLNVSVHASERFLEQSQVNLIIAFILGFFGLQVLELVAWFRSLDSLVPVLKYPELYLSTNVGEIFRSRAMTFMLSALALTLIAVLYLSWSVPLPADVPEGLTYVDEDNQVIVAERVLVRSVRNGELSAVCGGKENSDGVHLAEVTGGNHWWNAISPFFEKAALTWKTFPVKYGDWPPRIPQPERQEFSGEEILEGGDSVGIKEIHDYVCGGSLANPARDLTVTWDQGDGIFVLSFEPRLSFDKIVIALGMMHQKDLKRRRARRLMADREDLSSKFVQGFDNDAGVVDSDEFINAFDELIAGLTPGSSREILTQVMMADALFELYRSRPSSRLSPKNIERIAQRYVTEIGRGGVRAFDIDVMRELWHLLLKVEDFAGEDDGGQIHGAIAASLLNTGAEYYMNYLDDCSTRGLLSGSGGSGTERRKSFFKSAVTTMKQLWNFDGWLTNILSRAPDESTKAFLLSLGDLPKLEPN